MEDSRESIHIDELEDTLRELIKSILTWAKTPGNHGGNPYTKEFVQLALAAKKEL